MYTVCGANIIAVRPRVRERRASDRARGSSDRRRWIRTVSQGSGAIETSPRTRASSDDGRDIDRASGADVRRLTTR
jgi:hypothetical protein